jgi:cell division protein FtsZ
VQGITDLITTPGLINLDFADVKSVMAGAGSALMGIGSARGDDRAVAAAEMAISSPLLEASIDGAHGVLMNISGGSDLGLFEINEAAQLVADAAHAEANIIFGAVIDDALGDEVRVTVIAAGFDGGAPRARAQDPRRAQQRQPQPAVTASPRPTTPAPALRSDQDDETVDLVAAEEPAHVRVQETPPPAASRPQAPRRTIVFDDSDDDLDVPDFLK